MNKEDLQFLRNTIAEFMHKNEKSVRSSEREALDSSLVDELAQVGVLGSRIPTSMGGSELPDDAYFAILNELSKGSPSLAARVMITNSLFLPLCKSSKTGNGILQKVASGIINPAVSFSAAMDESYQSASVSVDSGRVSGSVGKVINSDCQACITAVGDSLVLVYGGLKQESDERALGLNALRFSSLFVDTDKYEVLDRDANGALGAVLDSIDMELVAISLGIASAALSLAIDYAGQRNAFGHQLKDYQPIAGKLARLKYEADYLTEAAQSMGFINDGGKIALKLRSLELAEEATDMSIQVHGGYGYFEDFGVERYYRDFATLQALFVRPNRDRRRLSTILYGEDSGYL